MRIDIWADLVCPFCYLGHRHLELALADFDHAEEVEVVWHAYQLDRTAPPVHEKSADELLAEKYGNSLADAHTAHQQVRAQGQEVGLDFRFDLARRGNTYDAHRVVAMAGVDGSASATRVAVALMEAYFTRGEPIGDTDTLVRLADEAGMDAEAVRDMLASEAFGYEVREAEATAKQLGINSVPYAVIDQKYGVGGMQPTETWQQILGYAWEYRGEAPTYAAGGGCGGGEGGCPCGNGGCGS